ncbi:hypothetical protein RRG08_036268 [Elysia crispata]|uniref:Uncharacterized protein n=1 Tax=Elysia crispata TaxID=231223 RepID=A0AAE0YX16_9GAST|nr:hypothetical protein RRG08_036268 [Elysia crispata]
MAQGKLVHIFIGTYDRKSVRGVCRLSENEATDYDRVKEVLQKGYYLTEDGYRQRFRTCTPDVEENPSMFIVRLKTYLERWIRGRIPLSERPASSLPISGKKPVAFSMHSDVRASRTALCASVMSGYITRLPSVENPHTKDQNAASTRGVSSVLCSERPRPLSEIVARPVRTNLLVKG